MFGGYVPNLHRVLARSPAVIEAFEAMRRLLQETKISALERELISIEVSRRSGCDYCMTAHTYFAGRMKLESDDIERARGRRARHRPASCPGPAGGAPPAGLQGPAGQRTSWKDFALPVWETTN